MRPASRIAASVLREVGALVKPGVLTCALDAAARVSVERHGAEPGLLGYRGYRNVLCVSVNNVAAHGIPNDYMLLDGDLVTLDVTVSHGGWYGDAAWTFVAGTVRDEARRLLRAAWSACMAAARAAVAGNRMGDIGQAAAVAAERHGCMVIPTLVGHGIGKGLHEEPSVVYDGPPGTGQPIVPGMVFTVEPVVSLGGARIRTLVDGWSEVTVDGASCAQFEHTLAVFGDRTELLTGAADVDYRLLDFPPFF